MGNQEKTGEEKVKVKGEVVEGGEKHGAGVAGSLVADRLVRQVRH